MRLRTTQGSSDSGASIDADCEAEPALGAGYVCALCAETRRRTGRRSAASEPTQPCRNLASGERRETGTAPACWRQLPQRPGGDSSAKIVRKRPQREHFATKCLDGPCPPAPRRVSSASSLPASTTGLGNASGRSGSGWWASERMIRTSFGRRGEGQNGGEVTMRHASHRANLLALLPGVLLPLCAGCTAGRRRSSTMARIRVTRCPPWTMASVPDMRRPPLPANLGGSGSRSWSTSSPTSSMARATA